jgi:hypothetical protein
LVVPIFSKILDEEILKIKKSSIPPKVDLIPSNKIGGIVSTAILITG